MTLEVEETQAGEAQAGESQAGETQAGETQAGEVPESAPHPLASWRARAGAFAVDVLPGSAVVATMALVTLALPAFGAWWWMCIVVLGLAILLLLLNRTVLPALTGWTLGRGLVGIVVTRRDGTTAEPSVLLLRDVAHLLDTASMFVGWLWPLWDSRRRTFADMLLRTEVHRTGSAAQPATRRRWVAAAMLVSANVCISGDAVSVIAVSSRDRAISRTREQIAVQGPKMVAQMLTYDPKTLQADFNHALSLTTDRYRGTLKNQQAAVQKGKPVVNEYWPIASAIESATRDRATMLLFMQGRRGAAPDERYISATIRVTFVDNHDSHWLVDELTVVTKPKPAGSGK